MDKTVADLSPTEFEEIVERTIDRRMQVWLTQILDAVAEIEGGEERELRSDFTQSLRRSIAQADAGEGTDVQTLRKQLGV